MKNVTYQTKVDADLWLEMNRRIEKKSKSLLTNMVFSFKKYPEKELPEDHWFNYQRQIDFDLMEYNKIYILNQNKLK